MPNVSQRNELYTCPSVGMIHASVWDLTSRDGIPDAIQPSSVDIVVLVFVLSALHPTEWAQAVSNIHKVCFGITFSVCHSPLSSS